jgi:hypothetical protein
MGNIFKSHVRIKAPATLQVGTEDATKLVEVIAGTATINLPSIPLQGVASASAAVAGLAATFAVIVQPRAWVAAEPVWLAGAVGIAGGIQVTGYNASASAVDPTSQVCNFFAYR